MKLSRTPSLLLTCMAACFLLLGCSGGEPTVDLGDGSTGNLLWGVSHYGFNRGEVDKGLVYCEKGLAFHGAEAREMQASLSGFPPTDPPEATFKYKALNDVGLLTLAKGELLLRKGDVAGAEAAYSMVIEDFGYAQVQELGEWGDYGESLPHDESGFIKLADAAKLKLAEIRKGKIQD